MLKGKGGDINYWDRDNLSNSIYYLYYRHLNNYLVTMYLADLDQSQSLFFNIELMIFHLQVFLFAKVQFKRWVKSESELLCRKGWYTE